MVVFSSTRTASRSGSRRGTVVVEGVDAVASAFTRKATTIGPAAGVAAVAAARRAAEGMRQGVPVDSGQVRDSITSDDNPTVEGGIVYADAGPTHFVARYIENGTVKMPPRPFVQPAADEAIAEFVRAIRVLT